MSRDTDNATGQGTTMCRRCYCLNFNL